LGHDAPLRDRCEELHFDSGVLVGGILRGVCGVDVDVVLRRSRKDVGDAVSSDFVCRVPVHVSGVLRDLVFDCECGSRCGGRFGDLRNLVANLHRSGGEFHIGGVVLAVSSLVHGVDHLLLGVRAGICVCSFVGYDVGKSSDGKR